MLDITIRDAGERDVNVLTELSRFVHDIHVAALPAFFKPLESDGIAEGFRRRLHNPDVRACIASAGELPVGYLVRVLRARAEDSRALARRFYEVEEIAVVPSHRKQGVAGALIDDVLREARSLGIQGVELTSWSFNATAHASFEALGFRPMMVRFRRELGRQD